MVEQLPCILKFSLNSDEIQQPLDLIQGSSTEKILPSTSDYSTEKVGKVNRRPQQHQ